MSKRRTKNEKVLAQHYYIYHDASGAAEINEPKIHRETILSNQPVLLTPRKLIVGDLLRIMIVSGLMLALEWGLYTFYLK